MWLAALESNKLEQEARVIARLLQRTKGSE